MIAKLVESSLWLQSSAHTPGISPVGGSREAILKHFFLNNKTVDFPSMEQTDY